MKKRGRDPLDPARVSHRSNQREQSLASFLHARWLSAALLSCESSLLLHRYDAIAVRRTHVPPTLKCNSLKARVIILTYNQNVRLLSPEPLPVTQAQSTGGEGTDIATSSSAHKHVFVGT